MFRSFAQMAAEQRHFNFEAMNLVPRKCIVNSRSECDTSVELGPCKFKVPVVPANMACVMDENLAIKMAVDGYFYIMHRFNVNTPLFVERMKSLHLPASISVGVNEDSYELLQGLVNQNLIPDYITIDIAHGHSVKMQTMIRWIKEMMRPTPFIIAGNVSTAEAVMDLEAWGADAIKVGIGPGSACTTYPTTGFGSKGAQASIVEQCALKAWKAHIIADGGIKEPGDIAKSIALGAKMVMVGNMFSGLIDSPGLVVKRPDGREYKEFYGSASEFNNGKKERVEGTKILVPLKKHTYLEELKHVEECLQSAISYAGGKDLGALRAVSYILR